MASILIAVLFTALFSSCKSSAAPDIIRTPIDSNPQSLDPQIAVGRPANITISNCFEGLVTIDGSNKIAPGVAKSWSVSPDNLTYTFKLRKDAKWKLPKGLEDTLGEGYEESFDTRVTARDFAFAFARALDPVTNSPNAVSLYAIKNAKAINSGSKNKSTLGVKAVDDYTLKITLQHPSANFLFALTAPIAMPCNEVFFESTSGRYGLSAKTLIYNGPFYIGNWDEKLVISLTKSDVYSGNNEVRPDGIRLLIDSDKSSYYSKLTSDGGYDFVYLSASDFASVKTNKDIMVQEYPNSVWGICFNASDTTITGDLRLALCNSINDNAFADVSPKSSSGIVPPACLLTSGTSYRSKAGQIALPPFNTSKANKYWSNYLAYREKNGQPDEISISMLCVEEHQNMLKRLVQEWQKIFGISFSVSIVAVPQDELYSKVQSGSYELAFAPILAEDLLATDFLSSFYSDAYGNMPHYSSSSYNAIIDNIRTAASSDKLLSLCKNAESHLIQNAVIYPVFYENSYILVRKNLDGLYIYPTASNIIFKSAKHK
jgi:oligopeptide transport system substrate-binding protein